MGYFKIYEIAELEIFLFLDINNFNPTNGISAEEDNSI